MIKSLVLVVVLGSYHLIRGEQISATRALGNGGNGEEDFLDEVEIAKDIFEEEHPIPVFVPDPLPKSVTLENPYNYKFLHRPIPLSAKVPPPDVRTNTVLIEGVTTDVKVKVPPLSDANKEKYGMWMFFDGYSEEFRQERPVMDFSTYPAGDAPAKDFPLDSWQTDPTYLMHFIDNAHKLIDRSRNAIYEEYGYPTEGESEDRDKLFGFQKVQNYTDINKQAPLMATEQDFGGLVRRLLHAMMTNSEFKVALNGHSVAAGHDSNFWQSYIHQFHHVMEPIFARLGMKLSTYNYGRGGLGTVQDTLAGTSTLGDPDVLIWDSGMTEQDKSVIDAFFRQATIAGTRVPFFIRGGNGEHSGEMAIMELRENGLPITPMDMDKREEIPWAARYMSCESSEMNCNKFELKFNKGCWDDNITEFKPSDEQNKPPMRGQHPSWRWYQMIGRRISLIFLHALEEAVGVWEEESILAQEFPLDPVHWHLKDHYEAVRKRSLESATTSSCSQWAYEPLRKICTVPMQGRSEFTGRANPDLTSLRTIIRPAADGYVPEMIKELVYDKPIDIEWQHVPEGEVDVRAIVGAGGFDDRKRSRELQHSSTDADGPEAVEPVNLVGGGEEVARGGERSHSNLRSLTEIVPGKGWVLQNSAPAGYCDGSTDYHSCNRQTGNKCLANDHQDTRTGVFGDELSGWIVFDIDNVVEGFVVVKIDTWHQNEHDWKTEDWSTVNNDRRMMTNNMALEEEHSSRLLESWPKDLLIDFAVDGVITTYDYDMMMEKVLLIERVVEVMVLHDEKPDTPKDMEIAMRIRCPETTLQHKCNINISHLYWA